MLFYLQKVTLNELQVKIIKFWLVKNSILED